MTKPSKQYKQAVKDFVEGFIDRDVNIKWWIMKITKEIDEGKYDGLTIEEFKTSIHNRIMWIGK